VWVIIVGSYYLLTLVSKKKRRGIFFSERICVHSTPYHALTPLHLRTVIDSGFVSADNAIVRGTHQNLDPLSTMVKLHLFIGRCLFCCPNFQIQTKNGAFHHTKLLHTYFAPQLIWKHMENRLRVFARIRPALPREISSGGFTRCVGVPNGKLNTLIITTTDRPILLNEYGDSHKDDDGLLRYDFDGVAQESSSNLQVYNQVCSPLIDGVLNGVNGCLLSYGETGSGKTHTMLGDDNDTGLIYLAARDLLKECETSNNRGGGKLSMSFMQVYGKELTDLLGGGGGDFNNKEDMKMKTNRDGGGRLNLQIRDTGEEIYVEGLSRWNVDSLDTLASLLKMGSERRAVANTKLNATSSRSHALVTFYFETISTTNMGAKLHMVDLAGSERVKDSGVSGKSLKEV
jgi:hypothetical protein